MKLGTIQSKQVRGGIGQGAKVGSAGRGFTLLEVVVAIGAVAIVTVGLAALFQTIGRTVSIGKKLNLSNSYAVLLEQQMRRDVAAMTRDGFLIIRNQAAMGGSSGAANGSAGGREQLRVRVWSDDPYPRPRRVDEIMFFARGEFQSQRPPLNPGLQATSDTARIYYGHGVRGRSDGGANYATPDVDTELTPGSGNASFLLGVDDARNPDRFAADWTLLRHVTLLVPKQQPPRELPRTGWSAIGINPAIVNDPNAAPAYLADSIWQVALQPAASSIFFPIARSYGPTGLNVNTMRAPSTTNQPRPMFASGLVDIAVTDLNEVRNWVLDLAKNPTAFDSQRNGPQETDFDLSFKADSQNINNSDLQYMQRWMLAAMPTASDARFNSGTLVNSNEPGQRIRYEDIGPNLLTGLRDATVDSNGVVSARGTSKLALAVERSDQLTLSAFRFLPRCSEFIVEWSFGEANPSTGETVWYGSRANTSELPSDPSINLAAWNADIEFKRYENATYTPWRNSIPDQKDVSTDADQANRHAIQPSLIYSNPGSGFPGLPPRNTDPHTAIFGYVDPTYVNKAKNSVSVAIPVRNEQRNFPASLPCPWPKLIRVTATINDAVDPSQSESFQFVFELPGNTVGS
ncbi:MAG: type II secretion system protein [Planctomycetota bacterium]|nr:type II secretion system protein [Planctomycetota bacterium]